MCGGVIYHYKGGEVRTFFPNPEATLPVKKQNGEMSLLLWGRRQHQIGKLPLGGWARLNSVYAGRWDRWFPRPVKLLVVSFMEKDIEGRSHWYELTRGQWIQGLVARNNYEQRIYVVTIEPEMEDAVHDRWPRILSG